ncbi:ATP-binding protein [Micromonospora sp. NBRC 107095]|uniref:AAA family ATPase n=1 Tax=Micromonospora sp. NBRC 107095 TaxID=3032209 RepID=UPI0024A18447|nr:ATP-binding protein [Micromonospora sp. NBRC 107095]GLZ57785.1 hypothetical protein Misp05_13610 [Micromonospora sp. NBRC 107095]
MKILSLSLPRYRNLRDFVIDFDEEQSTTALIGGNGTGKSHLIEAIVEIFRDLETADASAFPYRILYTCRGQTVEVSNDPSKTSRPLTISVNGERIAQKRFREQAAQLLPSYVFAYYSGWSDRLERQFDEPTRRHYEAVMDSGGVGLPLRRMFFCRKEYSQLVLLAFFLAPPDIARVVLEKYLAIADFDSALFVLKRPWWFNGKPNRAQLEDGDPRFWYARGAFRPFLAKLWSESLAPIRAEDRVARDIRKQPEQSERQYLFLRDLNSLARLQHSGDEVKELFGHLESLFLCDLIDEVRVVIRRTDGHRVKFVQMSEGEQQFLTVLGLMLFTRNDESLYLLDEPDTHLNPIWTYEYLGLLQDTIRQDKGQLLVATHNPLMIGGLVREQVRRFNRQGTSHVAIEPEYDPVSMSIEGVLRSEMYGLRSTLSKQVLALLDEQYALLGEDLSDQGRARLSEVSRELNELGIAHTYPNPYFNSFAAALARRRQPGAVRLTEEEMNEQAALSDQILRELELEDTGDEESA